MIQSMDNDHFFFASEHEHSVFKPLNYDYVGDTGNGSIFALLSISESFKPE